MLEKQPYHRRVIVFCCSLLLLLTAVFAVTITANDENDTNHAPKTNPVSAADQIVWLETEAFSTLGGWVVDQQFMDQMGSPYLLAHGIGHPVDDAKTTVQLPAEGTYRVWVRTRDWVAPWKAPGAPGRFQLLVNGKPLKTTFGTKGEKWHWQDGGQIALKTSNEIALHDLTGFEGRCDAVILSKNLQWNPPNDLSTLQKLRAKKLGWSNRPKEIKTVYDLVIVGGGIAGTSAAVTAARLGLKVALIQDRPVLGGNASSEIRVWPQGHINQQPYPRIGDVVRELTPKNQKNGRNGHEAIYFGDAQRMKVVQQEPNITLYLEHRVNAVTSEASVAKIASKEAQVQSVVAQHIRSARRIRIRGRWFLDSTGDGCVGYLAGADYEITRKQHLGVSNLWNIKCLCPDDTLLDNQIEKVCKESVFPRCPWAMDLKDKPFINRHQGSTKPVVTKNNKLITLGGWNWESGYDREPINEVERMRDNNFRAMYGAWDALKNVDKKYPAHRLNWVAYIAGKRESRRLMGDVIVTGDHFRKGHKFHDGAFPCTWSLDLHFPHPDYKKGHKEPFQALNTNSRSNKKDRHKYLYKGPYWAPYRALYSRNINNLFMAGRNISVTHIGLGAVRVMKTTGMMGEVVGMAASICKKHHCTPRDVYKHHLPELKALLKKGASKKATSPKK